MKRLGLGRYAICSCVAAALLAACGGSQPPISAAGAMPQSRASATHAERGGSWMLPEAKGEDLLYVVGDLDLYILSYPDGKLERKIIEGGGGAACSDNAGNVFVTSGASVLEYAHGGRKPIKTLPDPYGTGRDCSVYSSTGDLAVTNPGGQQSGNVTVYKRATGAPRVYIDPRIYYYWFCAYDASGNLFIDGNSQSYGLQFAELARGSRTFKGIDINAKVNLGSIQWDGSYITLANEGRHASVYRLSVSGSAAKIVGTTAIDLWRPRFGVPSQIHGGRFIAASGPDVRKIEFWPYPAGGPHSRIVRGGFLNGPERVSGFAISPSPTH